MKIKSLIIAVIAIVMAAAAGIGNCETYGEAISDRVVTPISDIFRNMDDYNGKAVTVKGTIAVECPSGCWFKLKEGSVVLHVDIKPAGIAIPQKVGRKVTVEGTVCIENGIPVLYGTGVKI